MSISGYASHALTGNQPSDGPSGAPKIEPAGQTGQALYQRLPIRGINGFVQPFAEKLQEITLHKNHFKEQLAKRQCQKGVYTNLTKSQAILTTIFRHNSKERYSGGVVMRMREVLSKTPP